MHAKDAASNPKGNFGYTNAKTTLKENHGAEKLLLQIF
jgi:hypothetical protein